MKRFKRLCAFVLCICVLASVAPPRIGRAEEEVVPFEEEQAVTEPAPEEPAPENWWEYDDEIEVVGPPEEDDAWPVETETVFETHMPEPTETPFPEQAPLPVDTPAPAETPHEQEDLTPEETASPEPIEETGEAGEELCPEETEEVIEAPEDLVGRGAKAPLISVSGKTYWVMAGAQFQLPVVVRDAAGKAVEEAYVLESSLPRTVAVSGTSVKALREGQATIKVTTASGVTASCEVLVVKKAKKVEIIPAESELDVGDTTQYALRVYTSSSKYVTAETEEQIMGLGTWQCADKAVAKVTAGGKVTALKPGTTQVRFTTANNRSATGSLHVYGAPATLKVEPEEVALSEGSQLRLQVSFGADERGKLRFESGDTGVVTVDEEGNIKAVATGTATVTVSTDNGLTAACSVTVTPAPVKASVSGETYVALVKGTFELPLLFYTKDGRQVSVSDYTVTSDSPKIAGVTGTTVKALRAGKATLTVKAGALTAKCTVQVVSRVKKVALSASECSVGVGSTERLQARIYTSSSDYITCQTSANILPIGKYQSSDKGILKVAQDGTLTGVKKGTATVTFTAGSSKAQCKVTVLGAPTKLKLDVTQLRMPVGGSRALTASFGADEAGTVTWQSSDKKVTKVSAKGVVTAVGEGTATIMAATGSLTAKCDIVIVPAPTKVSVQGKTYNLMLGAAIALPIEFYAPDGDKVEGVAYTVESANTKVAQISEGQVKAKREGTAKLTVTAGELKATCTVNVTKKPKSVELSATKLALGVGEAQQLKVRCVVSGKVKYDCTDTASMLGVATFNSSDKSVAKVSQYGLVTGVGKGTATITCTTANGRTAKCAVSVLVEATSIALDSKSLSLPEGTSATLKAVFPSGERSAVAWSADGTKVVSVSSDGVVTAKAVGKATITATTSRGLKATCAVTVTPVAAKITLDHASSNIAIKGAFQLKATALAADGTKVNGALAWTSSNERIATVSSDGLVKGLSAGTATITVSSKDNPKARATFTANVRKAPSKVTLTLSQTTTSVGRSVTVSGTVKTSNGNVSLSKADTSYAKVVVSDTSIARYDAATGSIVALDVGRVKVKIVTYNNKTSNVVTLDVGPRTDWILFDEPVLIMGAGQTHTLSCARSSDDVGAIAYKSDDTKAVKVSGSGTSVKITAVAAGMATVTATSATGAQTTCRVSVLAAPAGISFASDALTLFTGETVALPELRFSSNGGEVYAEAAYTSSNDCVSVTSTGMLSGDKAGTATVTAQTYNGKKAKVKVTVLRAPTTVKVSAGANVVPVGGTTALKAQSDGDGGVTWSVDRPDVAVIQKDGTLKGVSKGEAVVAATAANGVKGTTKISIVPWAERVNVDRDAATLFAGETIALKAASDGGYGTIAWSSSKKAVATVDASGHVRALAAGTAVIRAYIDGHSSAFDSVQITVEELPKAIALASNSLRLECGATARIEAACAGGVKYVSQDKAVATVTQDGVVRGVAAGKTVIRLTSVKDAQLTASVAVTVTDETADVTRMTIEPTEVYMYIGETCALTPVFAPTGSAAAVTYTAGGKAASVDGNGLVTALSLGKSVVTAATHDGKYRAKATVRVVARPERVSFAESGTVILSVGDTRTLMPPVFYSSEGDSYAPYTVTSSNGGCLRVRMEDGCAVLTGQAAGKVALRLKTDNGLDAWLTVRIVEKPTSISFGAKTLRLGKGASIAPVVTGSNGANVDVRLKSSDEGIVAVDGEGHIAGVAAGKAKLTATSAAWPEFTATVAVEVVETPESMSFEYATAKLAVGESLPTLLVFDKDGVLVDVTYRSSANGVCAVSADGTFTGFAAGKATVTATTSAGLTARCKVTVYERPESLSSEKESYTICTSDAVRITPVFEDAKHYANVTYQSADTSVATVDAAGTLRGVKAGDTTVTMRSFNGLSCTVAVHVLKEPTKFSVAPAQMSLLTGTSAALKCTFDRGGAYTEFSSSDESVLTVDDAGTVKAKKAGAAVVTARLPGPGLTAKVQVRVITKLEGFALQADTDTLELHQTVALTPVATPSDLACENAVTYVSNKPKVAQVDRLTGVVTGLSYGAAVITATASTGQTAKFTVNVLGGRRRMLIAYFFNEKSQAGYLPFAYNNAQSVKAAFKASNIEGQAYSISGPHASLSKAQLFSKIRSHFRDASDDDVSVIYICAHGFKSFGASGQYAFAVDSTHFVTAGELMDALEAIPGKVVLMLDSCYSGGFITANRARLNAQGGRIAVMTSSSDSTISSYWNTAGTLTSVDFFTCALLQGVGYNEAEGMGGARGWVSTTTQAADQAGDKDGKVTMKELFEYAKQQTIALVKKYAKASEFRGTDQQTPLSFLGKLASLVLFGR
ncbi:MAG: hypothetical protein E7317_05220 [Clostridiales bacterium]|nr:hypothetical protein [Clostridiales bacterium]